jgi:V8-like Glu-specific endopeptidase
MKVLKRGVLFLRCGIWAAVMGSLLGVVAACEDIDQSTRPVRSGFFGIVGGTETGYESWKGVVALYSDSLGLCTGSLIHPRVVLTAGHCVYLPSRGIDLVDSPQDIQILGGANVFTGGIHLSQVSRVIAHPTWLESTGTDLALLVLPFPLTAVEFYSVRSAPQPAIGQTGILVGYGLSGVNPEVGGGIHRMGDTTILRNNGKLIEVGNPASTCAGDSGGPFFTWQKDQWVVTGVTSFGLRDDCPANYDGFEVNVLAFRQWIHDAMMGAIGEGLDGAVDTDFEPDLECPYDVGYPCTCTGASELCEDGSSCIALEGYEGYLCAASCEGQEDNAPCQPSRGYGLAAACALGDIEGEPQYCLLICGLDGEMAQCPPGQRCQESRSDVAVCVPDGLIVDTDTEGEGGTQGEGEGEGEGTEEETQTEEIDPPSKAQSAGCGCRGVGTFGGVSLLSPLWALVRGGLAQGSAGGSFAKGGSLAGAQAPSTDTLRPGGGKIVSILP